MTEPDGGAQHPRSRVPVATVVLVGVTTVLWVAQLAHPALLDLLRRDPAALSAGQWWRVVSPLVVQDPPWQWAALGPLVLLAGAGVERLHGPAVVVVGYLLGGLVGEAVGYRWLPHGAGSSVAAAGLLGILVAWSLSRGAPRVLPRVLVSRVRPFAVATLCAAVVSVVVHDVHGLPLLVGTLFGALLVRRSRTA